MTDRDPAMQATLYPAISPETPSSFMMADVFAPGHMIEKNPVPIGIVAIGVASPEDVLSAIDTDEAGPDSQPRWLPYVFEAPDDPTDIALTDAENIALQDILARGGTIRVRGYGQEQDIPTSREEPDQDTGLMAAIRKTRVARTAATIGFATVGILSMFGTTASAKAADGGTPFGNLGNIPGLTGGRSLLNAPQDKIASAETAQASDTTTDPNLEQACIQAGTSAPKVLQWPKMYRAGIRPTQDIVGVKYAQHHQPEAADAKFEYPALEPPLTPADCAPDYVRVIGGRFYLQKAKVRGNPGDPIKNPGNWTDLTYQWQSLGGELTDPSNDKLVPANQGGISSVGFLAETLAPSFFNQCVNGRFLKVDYVARDTMKDTQTGQKIGQAYHIYDANVHGNCAAAAKSAKMAAQYQHKHN